MTKKLPKPKNKRGLIEKYYHLDLFQADFFLLIGEHAQLKDWAKDILTTDRIEEFMGMYHDIDSVSRGRQYPMRGGGSIIWVKSGSEYSYLIHELAHATTHLLRAKGMPVSSDTDELVAYLMACLYDKFS